MERFGYFVCRPDGAQVKLVYFHDRLFKNMFECMQDSKQWDEKIFYFKILNNSEIIKFVHTKECEKKFGYVIICDNLLNGCHCVCSWSPKFYEDMLDCISDGKAQHCLNKDEVDDGANQRSKIAYFFVLNDDELVTELHAPCAV